MTRRRRSCSSMTSTLFNRFNSRRWEILVFAVQKTPNSPTRRQRVLYIKSRACGSLNCSPYAKTNYETVCHTGTSVPCPCSEAMMWIVSWLHISPGFKDILPVRNVEVCPVSLTSLDSLNPVAFGGSAGSLRYRELPLTGKLKFATPLWPRLRRKKMVRRSQCLLRPGNPSWTSIQLSNHHMAGWSVLRCI